ncbi:MAG TPA: hypothetical protein V6C76_02200 [Drouetiella sp.]
MRELFYKLYFMLTGPLYRRLHREMSLELQEIVRANIEHSENFSRKILDELLRLSFIIDGGESALPGVDNTKLLSDAKIADVIKDVDSSLGMIEVCHKHDLPLSSVCALRSRFSGMNETGINRSRWLEEEFANLTSKVETLKLENERLLAASESK